MYMVGTQVNRLLSANGLSENHKAQNEAKSGCEMLQEAEKEINKSLIRSVRKTFFKI